MRPPAVVPEHPSNRWNCRGVRDEGVDVGTDVLEGVDAATAAFEGVAAGCVPPNSLRRV